MKKKVLFAAMALVALASCSDETFIGEVTNPQDNSPSGESNAIVFASASKGITRADIYGDAAAKLLGSNFYVTGTKGTEQSYYPTPINVFDNYLVHYGENTSGTTESNTANWEYVGIDQATGVMTPADYNRVKLSSIKGAQTIKYWDYSAAQYDFFGFSTGTKAAVNKTDFSGTEALTEDEIGVTAMLYGSGLDVQSTIPTAYTFYIPTLKGLENTYITDITEVEPTSYGKEVQLKFKNLGSKIRVALYETVPGYSVKNVKFYKADAGASPSDLGSDTSDDAYLIGASVLSFPTKGTVKVRFQHVGTHYQPGGAEPKEDYNKADAEVTPVSDEYVKYKKFGALTTQLVTSDRDEVKWDESTSKYITETGKVFLGRTLPTASFAGEAAAKFYQTVFPNTSGYPLTLRVDYTLVPIDGAAEVINVKGAKAVVPATYTTWLPNYAYTYVFKISDNTNGWTGAANKPSGLFPITFDAVVAEATDATGEQTTITTVATPSITTYQQGHNTKTDGSFATSIPDEYDKKDGKKLYVQVMDNNLSPSAVLVGTGSSTLPLLNAAQESKTPKYHASLLYKIDDDDATEAMVMDALENRDVTIGDYDSNVKGRNNIALTYNSNINNAVTSIENGVDNNAITVTAGQAAEIAISSLSVGTYAYVYDYSWESTSGAWSTSTTYNNKVEVVVYEPVTPASSSAIGSKSKYYSISKDALNGVTPSVDAVTVDNAHLYFSKTTNGTGTTTYSYISVVNKIGTTLPKGVVVVAKNDTSITEVAGSSTPDADTFYFDKFFSNNGKYAVKVIKVVDTTPTP